MKKVFRFLFWPYSRKKLLLEALTWVACIRIGLWLLPFRSLNAWLLGTARSGEVQQTDWVIIDEVSGFVRLCSRFIPHASCLTQALATRTLLHRVGQNCSLKIGVDKDKDQNFLAHAWIEVDNKIIIGKVREIGRYAIMSSSTEQLV